MRVITGKARGRKLLMLEGSDVRPTGDKVKEALFSILQFELEGRQVLDLFAGSGQLGIEALSRGAAHCTFVDASKASLSVVQQNLNATGFTADATVLCADALSFLGRTYAAYDIALLDPPYGKGLLQKALEKLPAVMRESGVIVCESPREEALPQSAGVFEIDRRYQYGKVALTVYRKKMLDGED